MYVCMFVYVLYVCSCICMRVTAYVCMIMFVYAEETYALGVSMPSFEGIEFVYAHIYVCVNKRLSLWGYQCLVLRAFNLCMLIFMFVLIKYCRFGCINALF
jgi:hypothetical protein